MDDITPKGIDRIYTSDETADMLKITTRTLFTLRKAGKIKAVRMGKRWIYTESDIRDFIASLKANQE